MRCSYCQSELEPTTELSVPLARCAGCRASSFTADDLVIWKGDSDIVAKLLAVASAGPTACPACSEPMVRAELELMYADLCQSCDAVLLAGPQMVGWVDKPVPEAATPVPAPEPGPLTALEERGIDKSEDMIDSSDRAIDGASRRAQGQLDTFNSKLDGCGGRIAAFFERLLR